jgi:hypothetical protein
MTLMSTILGATAAATAWLMLYDNERKAWRSPDSPQLLAGYAVLAACLIGVFMSVDMGGGTMSGMEQRNFSPP